MEIKVIYAIPTVQRVYSLSNAFLRRDGKCELGRAQTNSEYLGSTNIASFGVIAALDVNRFNHSSGERSRTVSVRYAG
eukprot:scaffold21682_cov22-Cyclotella_meneghiniana.AAC.2